MIYTFIIAIVITVMAFVARRYLYSIILSLTAMLTWFFTAFSFINIPAVAIIFGVIGISIAFYGVYLFSRVIR